MFIAKIMVATALVHPWDLVKVRVQISPRSQTPVGIARQIINREGFGALYTGLSAGLLRQATYTTTRLGVYNCIYDEVKRRQKKPPSFGDKLEMSIYAGMAGAVAGNPSEVALVRMMAGRMTARPCASPCTCRCIRKPYLGVFDALCKIMKEEGFRALWRGVSLTMCRSVVVSAAQVGCYTQVHDELAKRDIAKGYVLHFCTAVISSFVASILSLPVDLVKTRMVATAMVHPLDLIKVRMQVSPDSHSTCSMTRCIIKHEGCKTFYNGLSAGLMRQATNTTTRLWVYNKLYEEHKKKRKMPPSVEEKVRMGIYAGMAGAVVGNPSEVALVRMMAAGKPGCGCGLPCYYCRMVRPPYSGVFDAFHKIVRCESVGALWRGGTLTLGRSIIVSAAQIGTYIYTREVLCENNVAQGYRLHFYTALISSFVTSVLTLPIDFVKSRYQVLSGGVNQVNLVKALHQRRGVLYFWKGFLPYYLRMTVHTVLTFMMLQEINALYYEYLNEIRKNKK